MVKFKIVNFPYGKIQNAYNYISESIGRNGVKLQTDVFDH